MATNLAINDNLLNEAKFLGHHKTKKETVNAALLEYIQRDQIEYDSNYKKARIRSCIPLKLYTTV